MTTTRTDAAVTQTRTDADAETRLNRFEEMLVAGGLRLVQRLLLILVALMTVAAAAIEVQRVADSLTINLGDILLMFLYTEIIAMIAVFYTGRGLPFVYPIFIAITALARLIVLQSKDMDPRNIVLEAGAILLLSVAAVVLLRMSGRSGTGER